MNQPIIVAIPTNGESPLLRPLVEKVLDDSQVEDLLIITQSYHLELDLPEDPRIIKAMLPERNISTWSNWAVRYAAVDNGFLALLNDDIEFDDPYPISQAAQVFVQHPKVVAVGFNYEDVRPGIRYCTGSYRNNGIGGFAFMVDSSRCPLVDEQFQWWYSEDDLFNQIAANGDRMAIAMEVAVHHVAETTASKHAWTYEARALDRLRYIAKYGVGSA